MRILDAQGKNCTVWGLLYNLKAISGKKADADSIETAGALTCAPEALSTVRGCLSIGTSWLP